MADTKKMILIFSIVGLLIFVLYEVGKEEPNWAVVIMGALGIKSINHYATAKSEIPFLTENGMKALASTEGFTDVFEMQYYLQKYLEYLTQPKKAYLYSCEFIGENNV